MSARKAIVVGAGIGGLTAALELCRSGFDVRVFERRPELGEVNTGLSLWAFAIRRLERLGIGDPGGFGVPIERLVHKTAEGKLLADVAVPQPAGAVSYDVHRGQLQTRLADALGENRILLSRPCVAVREAGERVEVETQGGGTETADCVVGADGVGSTVRTAAIAQIALRRNEIGVWRGITAMPEDELPRGLHVRYIGARALFGMARLSRETVRWYAGTAFPEIPPPTGADAKALALQAFADWPPQIVHTLERTPEDAYLFNDTPHARPLRTWGRGRITLLGDAAHPMLPTLGIAGGVAIEDAAVLGECLRAVPDPVTALRLYERRRRGIARRIAFAARAFERTLMIGPQPLQMLRAAAFRAAPQRLALRWLVGGGSFRQLGPRRAPFIS